MGNQDNLDKKVFTKEEKENYISQWQLSQSLGTTNCIENSNSQMAKYVRNVKNWSNNNQRQRW